MLKTDCDFNLGLDQKSIDSVLPKCRESLLSTSHSLTISSSFCKTVSMLDKHLSATKIAESSAYNINLLQTAPYISLTYIKNKRGPSIEHHMKYSHVRKEFQIHPLAVDDQINRLKPSGYVLTEAKSFKFH